MNPYYQDDAVAIYHGDCLTVLGQLDQVDHLITDPPFEEEAHTLQRRVLRQKTSGGRRDVYNGALPFSAITEEQRQALGKWSGGGCRGWALVFCQAEALGIWRKALEEGGAKWRRAMVWIKPDGMPQFSGDRPGMGYESIAAAWCGKGGSRWNGGGQHGVFTIPKHDSGQGHGGGSNEHPTQKPMRLMLRLVDLFSQHGETILDPFMGSGTTLRAAKDLGRKAIGIEIEERYCEIAAKRMAQEVLL